MAECWEGEMSDTGEADVEEISVGGRENERDLVDEAYPKGRSSTHDIEQEDYAIRTSSSTELPRGKAEPSIDGASR